MKKYGLNEDDFVLDTRGEPTNSKSNTEDVQVHPDVRYVLYHVDKVLSDRTSKVDPNMSSSLHKSKPCLLHCVANLN